MARKTKTVVITTDDLENRDKDKVFVITEMSAFQGDVWGKKAILACSRGEINQAILGDIENAGIAGIAALGFQFFGSLRWEDAEPLLAELMSCVKYMPDPTKPMILRPIGAGGSEDIEEISTISYLQMEVFNLHVNFSKLVSGLKSKIEAMMVKIAASQNIET